MNEIIERAARALCKLHFSNGGVEDDGWDDCPEKFRLEYMAEVQAVIEALREPTTSMIDAAWAEAHEEDAAGVWRAMIGEALKPGVQ